MLQNATSNSNSCHVSWADERKSHALLGSLPDHTQTIPFRQCGLNFCEAKKSAFSFETRELNALRSNIMHPLDDICIFQWTISSADIVQKLQFKTSKTHTTFSLSVALRIAWIADIWANLLAKWHATNVRAVTFGFANSKNQTISGHSSVCVSTHFVPFFCCCRSFKPNFSAPTDVRKCFAWMWPPFWSAAERYWFLSAPILVHPRKFITYFCSVHHFHTLNWRCVFSPRNISTRSLKATDREKNGLKYFVWCPKNPHKN